MQIIIDFQIRALHNIVWLMSNLCRSSHSAKVELLMPALSYLLHHDDSAILCEHITLKEFAHRL